MPNLILMGKGAKYRSLQLENLVKTAVLQFAVPIMLIFITGYTTHAAVKGLSAANHPAGLAASRWYFRFSSY